MPLLTIITPTYNRSDLLKECWDSLKKQTCKDFQWLIIDDGSSDDTKSVVDSFLKDSDFSIEYHYKQNGGKHTALNYAHPFIKGDYVLILDSDDILVPDAVDKILSSWNKYRTYSDVGEINYLRGISKTEPLCYVAHPGIIVDPVKEKRIMILGRDCCETYRKDLFIQYPFVVFPEERFLGEGSAFFNIEKNSKCVYFNEVLYIGEYLNDGLTMQGRAMRLNNPKGGRYNSLVYMDKCLPLKRRLRKGMLFVVYSNLTGDNYYKDNPYKLLTTAVIIPGNILYLYWKYKYRKDLQRG